MNRITLLENALCAVDSQRASASIQLKTAKDIQDKSLVQFWQQEIATHKATYQGLLALIHELKQEGGKS